MISFFFLSSSHNFSRIAKEHPASERNSKGELSKCPIELYCGIWMCVGRSVSSE